MQTKTNFYEWFLKYLVYWPWFLGSIGLCLAAMYIYLRFQTPEYHIQASVLIKEQENE